jgi:hypothetical protein
LPSPDLPLEATERKFDDQTATINNQKICHFHDIGTTKQMIPIIIAEDASMFDRANIESFYALPFLFDPSRTCPKDHKLSRPNAAGEGGGF